MSYAVEDVPVSWLRPHPENVAIFGDPEESGRFVDILKSIKANGIREALKVKADGTILAGHTRRFCAMRLGLETVPVHIVDDFETYFEEVKYLILSNTDRKPLTPGEIALAFRRLKEIPREQGGAKAKHGGDRQSADAKKQGAESRTLVGKTRDAAAEIAGVSRDVAESCEAVFFTEGVPDELKAAVNAGQIAKTTAAKAVRAEVKRQGGRIESPAALVAMAQPKAKEEAPGETTEQRAARLAARFQSLHARLFKAYQEVDAVLSSQPLKSLLGPTEHHDYRRLIHDLAIRAWREIESVDGPTVAGRQMMLTVIQGGK